MSASRRETSKRSSPATRPAAELDAMVHPGVAFGLLVRRLEHRHEDDAVQLELRVRLLRAHEMADVRRVERPAEEADPRQPRI